MSTTTKKKPASAAPKTTRRRSKSPSATAPKTTKPVSPVSGTAPKPTPAAAPTIVAAPQAVVVGSQLRKKELIDDVVTRTGMKKKDVKPIVEATIAALGEALTTNRELVLPPFGKLRVRREKEMSNARVLTAKIRQPKTT